MIGAVLVKNQTSSFQTASLSTNAPYHPHGDLGAAAAPYALVRFTPESAGIADITALLDRLSGRRHRRRQGRHVWTGILGQ